MQAIASGALACSRWRLQVRILSGFQVVLSLTPCRPALWKASRASHHPAFFAQFFWRGRSRALSLWRDSSSGEDQLPRLRHLLFSSLRTCLSQSRPFTHLVMPGHSPMSDGPCESPAPKVSGQRGGSPGGRPDPLLPVGCGRALSPAEQSSFRGAAASAVLATADSTAPSSPFGQLNH